MPTHISRDEALAHFGVRGMRWGVRKDSPSTSSNQSKKGMSKKKKVAIGAGVVVAGSAITVSLLAKNGKIPISELSEFTKYLPSKNQQSELWNTAPHTADRGARKVKQLSDSGAMELKFKQLMKEFDADIAEAHKEQTTWMFKNTPNYNPRDNPFVPEYELERLRGG